MHPTIEQPSDKTAHECAAHKADAEIGDGRESIDALIHALSGFVVCRAIFGIFTSHNNAQCPNDTNDAIEFVAKRINGSG